MKTLYYPAALALLAVAAPASASPQQDAECLIGRLSGDDVSAIVAETQTGRSEVTIARMTGPVEACSRGQSWDGDRRGNAAGYAIGVLARDTFRRRLGAAAVDTTGLDRWFARQTLEFRTTAFMSMDRARLEATLATMVGKEVTAESMQREGLKIGGYLGALMVIERIERGLGM